MSPKHEIIRPDNLQEHNHRPAAHPMPREVQSQEAQIQGVHQHGTGKDVKVKMGKKVR